eukprot:scaffold206890_cov32-Tisochrysis_lutea.AAC.1
MVAEDRLGRGASSIVCITSLERRLERAPRGVDHVVLRAGSPKRSVLHSNRQEGRGGERENNLKRAC